MVDPADDLFPKPHKGGMALFAIFVGIYGAFVGVNAFAPEWMEREVIPGINLAVAWGMGIILATFIIAAVYSWMRRSTTKSKKGAHHS